MRFLPFLLWTLAAAAEQPLLQPDPRPTFSQEEPAGAAAWWPLAAGAGAGLVAWRLRARRRG